MFNKPTELTFKEINIPDWCYFDLTVWVSYDTATEKEIVAVFKELAHDFGKTVIVVTHSDSVSKLSDQRLLLSEGILKDI